jgi:hypothetical protein
MACSTRHVESRVERPRWPGRHKLFDDSFMNARPVRLISASEF